MYAIRELPERQDFSSISGADQPVQDAGRPEVLKAPQGPDLHLHKRKRKRKRKRRFEQ